MDERRVRLLTEREAAAVAAVTAHYAEHGRPPSTKEIARRLGVRTSQADRLVKAAAGAGSLVVCRQRGVRTQIRLFRPLAEVATLDLAAELAGRAAAETVPHPGNGRETNHGRLAA